MSERDSICASEEKPLTGGIQAVIRSLLDNGVLVADQATGLVYSTRFSPPKRLGTLTSRGYLVATSHLDGKKYQIKLHQVVWLSAHAAIPKGRVVDHKNRIKTDNRLDNLRLADALLNSQNRRSYSGEGNPAAKVTKEIADRIRAYPKSLALTAVDFGVSKSLVAAIRRGELWS